MTTTDQLSELVRHERRAFIETLGTLRPGQWLEQSLCSEWRVVDVAAHLAWAPVLGPLAGAVTMARNGFSMNRTIASSAREWSSRGREAIVEQLERNLDSAAKPIGMPTVASLADAVVHGIDVRRPLGLVHPLTAELLAPVADFALRTRWPLNAVVGGSAARRVRDVRLVTSDVDWSHGAGPEVHASAETVARLLYGRSVATHELTGPGADLVRPRL